jgi:signal transduction histidine kinase
MVRCLVYAIWLTVLFAASTAAQPAARSVLLMHSFDAGYAVDIAFARAVRTELARQSSEPLNFFEVSVRPTPSAGPLQEEAVANYLRSSLAGQRLDLVVTVSPPAALFARKYREQLFPDTPILLAGVDQRWIQHEVLTGNEAAVPIAVDPARVVEDILRVRPETTNLVVVVGASVLERDWRDEFTREFQPFADRLTFTWFNTLSFAEMLKRTTTLPASSAILYSLLSVDAKGFSYSEDRVLAQLHEAATAPLFGLFSHQMGSGVVGGPILSIEDVARDTAGAGVRLLSGESAATIKTAIQTSQRPMYDWRELQRWGISESRLPAGSTIMFRQPGVWDQYKVYIVGAAVIVVLQSAFIAGFVVQRIRRRRTELALRQSYEQNQDLAGRLISAQEEERTRIARELHDDLSQQLGGLGIALSGLKRKIGKPGAEADIDRTVTTLQDRTVALAESVRNLSHELHPSVLEHVGLVATLRRHCADVEELHHLEVSFSARDNLDSLTPAVALCLFRVAQEALGNAARHARASTIRVELMTTHEGVELRVVDNGIGFVASERAGSGLGLRSIDERVRLTKGSVTIESRPGHGTDLLVRIPLAASQVELVRQV